MLREVSWPFLSKNPSLITVKGLNSIFNLQPLFQVGITLLLMKQNFSGDSSEKLKLGGYGDRRGRKERERNTVLLPAFWMSCLERLLSFCHYWETWKMMKTNTLKMVKQKARTRVPEVMHPWAEEIVPVTTYLRTSWYVRKQTTFYLNYQQ